MPEMNLPTHWKTARLEEVTDIFKGGTPKRSVEKYFRGDIPWAIPTDITALDSALYINDTDTHISEEALGKSAARLLPEGTVLLTSRATIGETAIATVPMATNQGFANFICRDMLLNVYLAYYLRYIKKRLIDLAHGSTFKEITKGTLLNVEIPLPPLPEQRAIAHVLQTIQEAKSARQRELTLERERKAALMDYLFSYGTKAEPRKQTEIGEIPESWEVTRLGDLVKLKSGLSRPKDMENKLNSVLTVPVYGGNGVLGYTSKEFSEQRLLVIGRVGEYCGCVHIAESPNWITDNALYSERWFNSEISLDFLAEQLTHFNLNRLKRRGGQPLITQTIIHELKIPLPPLPEQRAIAEIVQAFDKKIIVLEQEAARLDELFHAMLDELMTGQRSALPLIDAELPHSSGIMEGKRLEGVPSENSPKTETCLRSL